MVFKIIITLILGFLLGCIPGAAIAAKVAGRKLENDVTTTGVLRELGISYALVALGIDVLKGFLAALVGYLIVGDVAGLGIAVGGIAVMLGHVYNVAYGFKGPKGIAPYGGVLIMLSWWLGIALLILGVLIFAGIKFYKPLVIVTMLLVAILVSVFVSSAWGIVYAWLMFAFSLLLQKDHLMSVFAGRPSSGSSGSKGSGRRLR